VSTILTAGCAYALLAVQFGTPAAGAGPLTDYEYNLLNWTDATYPIYKTVLTVGRSGANIILASNIAEQPNSGGISEQFMPTVQRRAGAVRGGAFGRFWCAGGLHLSYFYAGQWTALFSYGQRQRAGVGGLRRLTVWRWMWCSVEVWKCGSVESHFPGILLDAEYSSTSL
jgi:hypothetical protein